MGNNRNWDGTCNARVRKITIGWTIEIEYPFSTLNFDRNAPAWGVNSQRTIRRKNEENVWTGHLRNQGLRRMSNAGLLVGIRDVNQGLGLNFPSTPQPTSRTLRAGKIRSHYRALTTSDSVSSTTSRRACAAI